MPLELPTSGQQINVDIYENEIVLMFAIPTQEVHMDARTAAELARALAKMAKALHENTRADDYSLSNELPKDLPQ